MQRTTIVLQHDLKLRAVRKAREFGISFTKFTQLALEKAVNESTKVIKTVKDDPFFSDSNFWEGDVPNNLSTSIDDEIYDILEEKQTKTASYRKKKL